MIPGLQFCSTTTNHHLRIEITMLFFKIAAL
uniref:Uncharacterized protein n=1 Tax=Arundo donax TaxID=35708 RepID=A0A0A9EI32_ARUDO